MSGSSESSSGPTWMWPFACPRHLDSCDHGLAGDLEPNLAHSPAETKAWQTVVSYRALASQYFAFPARTRDELPRHDAAGPPRCADQGEGRLSSGAQPTAREMTECLCEPEDLGHSDAPASQPKWAATASVAADTDCRPGCFTWNSDSLGPVGVAPARDNVGAPRGLTLPGSCLRRFAHLLASLRPDLAGLDHTTVSK